ncbi:hypothetical protein ACM43_06830 [Bradyrhizobium sp. CCBAU 45321]|nr:hypothetical protein [Bradyrhizobium sp. CCBAU 45321]
MTRSVIRLPPTLNMSNALRLRRKLAELDEDHDYLFDFELVGHTDPFGLLLVSDAISSFQSRQVFGDSTCRNYQRMSYQSVMGFFRACGFEYGYAPGEAGGGSNYLPITHLDYDTLNKEAEEQCIAFGEAIELRSRRMAEVLSRQPDGDLCEALTYALREVIRNVFEHSGADQVQFCAQHWPSRNRVHLAILDKGTGVRRSLSRNPYLTINSDLDALKLSLMPGVSGKMYKGIKRRKHDTWQNSGYGLYMTSRLAVNGGNFWIISGENAFGVASERTRELHISEFEGTALRVSFDTTQLKTIQTKLKRIKNEGHELAKLFSGADPRGASLASTTIRTKF